MIMFNSLVYKKSLLHEDVPYDIAEQLFQHRRTQKISLEEVCQQTNIDLLELDSLECGQGDIDFKALSQLLDLYEIKLTGWKDCFPDLPQEFYGKYFQR